MHPDPLSSANRRRPGDGGGQLIAGVQLLGLVGVWLATLPIIPLYAGGVWAGRAVKRRLAQSL
jgi:hypothetical protein